MKNGLLAKVAALSAIALPVVMTPAAFATGGGSLAALTAAQSTIEADIATAAGVMLALAIAVLVGFYIVGVIRGRR